MDELLQYLVRKNIQVCKAYNGDTLSYIQFDFPFSTGEHEEYRSLKVVEDKDGNVMASYRGYDLFQEYLEPYQIFRVFGNIIIKDHGDAYNPETKQKYKQIEIFRKDTYNIKSSGYEFDLGVIQ